MLRERDSVTKKKEVGKGRKQQVRWCSSTHLAMRISAGPGQAAVCSAIAFYHPVGVISQ